MNRPLDDRAGALPGRAYLLVAAATLLGLAHHLDHVVRRNHVRWPVTPEVAPFTHSLALYPLVGYLAFGVLLALVGVVAVGAGYSFQLWRRQPRTTDPTGEEQP